MTNTPSLDQFVQHARARRGNAPRQLTIICADGYRLSVVADPRANCIPNPAEPWDGPLHEYHGSYTHVEVGLPSSRPEPWQQWKEHAETPDRPTETIYGFVPVETVRELIEAHGGEARSAGPLNATTPTATQETK